MCIRDSRKSAVFLFGFPSTPNPRLLISISSSSTIRLTPAVSHSLNIAFTTVSYTHLLYKETGDIYLVADVLGHKDVNTTKKHYAAIDEDRRRQAANIVKLREV